MTTRIALLVLVLLIAACRPAAEPVADVAPTVVTPTTAPTAISTGIPTAVPTAAPTAAPTAVPTAVPTAAPTATATPVPTAAPTRAATPTPTAEPTPEAEPDYTATLVAVTAPRELGRYPSPDGAWEARILIYDCTDLGEGAVIARDELWLTRLDDGSDHLVAEQMQWCGGLGAAGLDGRGWSRESGYFYFTDARDGFPDGCGYWETPLLRVEAATQAVTALGFAYPEPGGTRLAAWQARDLVVWAIDGEATVRVTADVAAANLGPVVWSPDGTALVYSQYDSYCTLSGLHLRHVDLTDGSTTAVLDNPPQVLGDVRWEEDGVLLLSAESGAQYQLDLATGTLTPADE